MNIIFTKKIIIILLLILLVVSLILNFYLYYNHDSPLEFEEVYVEENMDEMYKGAYWFSLRHKKYGGFFGNEIKDLGVNFNQFNFNKYTYIITFGYELSEISYSLNATKNRKFIFFPKEFIGKVVFKDEYKNNVYIYRIKKIDIDCDYHSREDYVTFIKDLKGF